AVIVENAAGHFHTAPVTAGATTRGSVVGYRFAADLYYANTNSFNEEILELVGEGAPDVTVLILDAGVMFDVDYSGGETLKQVFNELHDRGVKLVIADLLPPARAELDRYGGTELLGSDAYLDSLAEAAAAVGGTPSA